MKVLVPQFVGGEARVRDTDLAVRLGFERPRKIRDLIAPHRGALSQLGSLIEIEEIVGKGQKAKVYYLNRQQAIFITAKSETIDATAITIEIVRRFDAYEQGSTPALTASQVGGITKAVMTKALEAVHARLDAVLAGFDPSQITVTDFRPMLAVLIEHDVGPRKRRRLSQRCSTRCRRWLTSASRGGEVRTSRESGRYIFSVAGIRDWLAAEGAALIQDHKVALAGQTVMQFAPRLIEKSSDPKRSDQADAERPGAPA